MKRTIIFVASVVLFVGLPLAAFAISYQPGETLDPSCPPSDPTCIVVPNTTSSSFTATSSSATSTFAGDVQVGGTASSTNAVVSGSLTLGSLNGILKAVAGVVETALVNLATDVTGILGIGNGGTGIASTPSYGQLLVGNGSGGYALTATSSLGINRWGTITGTLASQTDLANALNALLPLASWYATSTSALAEGTNLYWTNNRFDARLAATTSLPNITTLANLASVGTITSGSWHGTTVGTSYGGTGVSSYSPGDILYADNTGTLQRLPIGSTGNTLQVQAGLPAWGTAPSGGGGGAGGVWATTTNSLAIYPASTAYQVIVGGSATSTLTSIFEVHGGAYVSGNVGIGTTSPVTNLAVAGNGYLTGALGVGVLNTTAGTVQTSGNALFGGTVTGSSFSGAGTGLTGTASSLSIGGNANTATTLQSARTINNVSFDGSGNITINAASSTALSDNNSWSGTNAFGTISAGVWHGSAIGASYGGTGSSTLSGILVGNGTSAVNSLAFSGPLSLSGSTLSVQQASGSQLGFLASTDWTTFNNKVSSTSLSALAPLSYNSGSGSFGFDFTHANSWTGTQTFGNIADTNATTSSLYVTGITSHLIKTDVNGQLVAAVAGSDYQAPLTTGNLTVGSNLSVSGGTGAVIGSGASITLGGNVVTAVANDTNVTGSIAGNNLTLGWTGTLGVGRGGTGIGSPAAAAILLGNYAGTGYQQLATSSLGLLTTNVAEGTNLYFTNARAQAAISVSGAPLTYSGGAIGINQASGSQNGFLASTDWANFNSKIASTSLSATGPLAYNSATGVFSLGTIGIGFGGTGITTTPTFGQLLIGNGSGGYALTSTTSLGILGGTWGNITGTLSNQTDLQNALNLKLSSSSLATSADVANIVSDETGSGSLVFATSPTLAGTPTFGGGAVNYSVNSTTTIPTGNPYAWTVATSTSASPLIEVDTSGSNGAVSIGNANVSSPNILLGATGQPANLVFAASSTIEGAGTGQLITIGANADTVDFGGSGNVGIGTTTPGSLLSLAGLANLTTATSSFYSTGGLNLAGGCFSINGTCIGGSGGGVGLGNPNTWTALQTFGAGFIAQASSTVVGPLTITGALTLGTATTTTGNGFNITTGCFSINGTCITGGGGPTYTFSYPLVNSANTISEAWGTTTANTWSSLQTFGAGASTTNLVISNLGNTGTNCLQVNSLGQISTTGAPCGGSGSVPGGSSGQIQFNSASTFGGASNLWWDSSNNRLGIGTSSPYAELSVATPPGASGSVTTLFAIASSTAGSATTTLFSIDNMGDVVSTLAASSTFTVGANGMTNPAFQIYASTTNAVTGLQLVSNLAGNGVILNTLSTATNENLTINSKGTGIATLNSTNLSNLAVGGVNKVQATASGVVFVGGHASGVTGSDFLFDDNTDTQLTAGTESILNEFNVGNALHKWANGNVPLERDFAIMAGTHLMNSSTLVGNFGVLDTAYVSGAPLLGNFATSTNEYTLYLDDANALNASTTNSYGLSVNANTGAKNNYAAEFLGGNVGIGSTTPQATLEVWGPDTGTTSAFTVSNAASSTNFTVYDSGNALLAGSLVQNSDIRLKTDIQSLDGSTSLAEINNLNPITFNWIDPAKSSIPQLGFIAQQVQSVFPNLVSTTSPTALTPDGTLSLNYIDLISPIVAAIQQLDKEITSLASTVAGFAQSFTTAVVNAATGNFGQVNTNELCVQGTCVTGAQLAALLASANQSGSTSASPSPSTSTDAPPVIAINGSNPAIIQVGTTYSDLGASITGPQADLNLGMATFVNGTAMNPVQIDTSVVATDTIDYVVTDSHGLTSTSTRTVIIEAANDSEPSSTPTNDDTAATTTTATSTSASQ